MSSFEASLTIYYLSLISFDFSHMLSSIHTKMYLYNKQKHRASFLLPRNNFQEEIFILSFMFCSSAD